MFAIWWCPCVGSFVLLEEGVCYDWCILLAILWAFILLHSVLQGQICLLLKVFLDFPGGSDGKASAYNVETWVWFLGGEDPLEKEMASQSSTLAWKIPWEEPGRLQSMGSLRVRHNWATLLHFIHLELPSHPCFIPISRSSQGTQLSPPCCVQQLPTSDLFYTL